MHIDKTFRYRIYPTSAQVERIEAWEDALRCLWNLANEQRLLGLARSKSERKYYTAFDQQKDLTELRAEFPWMADVPYDAGSRVLVSLHNAWQCCFKKTAKRPRWKLKGSRPSSLHASNAKSWRLSGDVIRFPKLGNLRAVIHRPLEGTPKTCTIKRDGDQWFASIACVIKSPDQRRRGIPVVAIDLGIVVLAALSNGEKISNPRFMRASLQRLGHAKRAVERKKKGSKNREKARLHAAHIYRLVCRQREHYLHEQSTQIAKSHGVVVMEHLNVKDMVRSHFGRDITDAGWARFTVMLQYKQAWSGGSVEFVHAAYSSQTCSDCECVDRKSRRSQSEFVCTACGHTENADVNAAKVLLKRRESLSVLPVEGPPPGGALRSRKRSITAKVIGRSSYPLEWGLTKHAAQAPASLCRRGSSGAPRRALLLLDVALQHFERRASRREQAVRWRPQHRLPSVRIANRWKLRPQATACHGLEVVHQIARTYSRKQLQKHMHMVDLSIDLHDTTSPRLSRVRQNLLASFNALGSEDSAPVLRHQNQVGVHLENSVAVGRKLLHVHPSQGIAPEVQRVYRYRLYPTEAQSALLLRLLIALRTLYNACLQERRDAWQKQRISVSKKMQDDQLRAVREGDAEYKGIHFHLLQDVVLRCDRAFQNFFRRVKAGVAGSAVGFPRFKGRDFYKSFTFKDAGHSNGAALCAGGKRLRLHGIGNVKIKLHRAHEGTLKQARIIRLGDGHWYADFICVDVQKKLLPLATVSAEVGIDLGLKVYAKMSDDTDIENPRYAREGAAQLAAAQRRLSSRKRGSNRRRKARTLVAKHHLHVARQRLNFQHKEALKLLRKYQTIYVEDLNVKGLAAGMLAKSVSDAAWGQFISILSDKAESAGREVVKVNPSGTSQRCSECGAHVPKELSMRVHRCACGYMADRDLNAARNILRLGQSLREVRHAA